MKKVIATDKAPAAVGAYSQAIQYNGFLFSSGQIPIDPATGNIVTGDIKEQATQVMKNLEAILAEAGTDFSAVVKTTIFLNDINDFGAVNEVYQSFFTGAFPARSCFEVANLPKGVGLEIEVIAAL
ncbi:MAG: RidA family protein [Clostridiales bacterium]|nr:RidA family protein [Clostridiales bacterium]